MIKALPKMEKPVFLRPHGSKGEVLMQIQLLYNHSEAKKQNPIITTQILCPWAKYVLRKKVNFVIMVS